MKIILAAALAFFPLLAYAYVRKSEEGALPALAPMYPDDPGAPAALPLPSFLESIGLMTMSQTRGERNNNPGNIVQSPVTWRGKVAGVDSRFESFESPAYGIRALGRLLQTYQTTYGLRTVRGIIGRYAPASENNTDAYVRAVADRLNVSPDAEINLTEADILSGLVAAIIQHENGRNLYSAAEIAAALAMA